MYLCQTDHKTITINKLIEKVIRSDDNEKKIRNNRRGYVFPSYVTGLEKKNRFKIFSFAITIFNGKTTSPHQIMR